MYIKMAIIWNFLSFIIFGLNRHISTSYKLLLLHSDIICHQDQQIVLALIF